MRREKRTVASTEFVAVWLAVSTVFSQGDFAL